MGKTILVTGTSSGFGRDTAETLAADGHRVFAAMRNPAGRNADRAAALRANGTEVIELDAADTASVERAVAEVVARAGRIDVLVNNAGVSASGIAEAFTAEQARAMFEVNVFGVHRATRAVLPHMRAQRSGLIVTVGSIVGRVVFPFMALYGASKFALEALTDGYRYELAKSGIDVVLVQPSAYPTGIAGNAIQPADPERAAGYGEILAEQAQMRAAFGAMLQGDNPPDPRDVAAAIADLARLGAGERPERVVVGKGFGAEELNRLTVPVQRAVLDGLGLGALTAA